MGLHGDMLVIEDMQVVGNGGSGNNVIACKDF